MSGHIASYQAYLDSPYWQELKRLYYAAHPKARCVICKSRENLDLHHETYEHLGREDFTHKSTYRRDLVTLCRKHHALVHEYYKSARASGYPWVILKRIIGQHKKRLKKDLPPPGQDWYDAVQAFYESRAAGVTPPAIWPASELY